MTLKAPTLTAEQLEVHNPSGLEEHRAFHQERWGEFDEGFNVGEFNCERGFSTHKNFKSTTSCNIDSDGTLWIKEFPESSIFGEQPFKVEFNVGKEHYTNAEILFELSRYWPRFKGFSFESYNGPASSNVMYLRRVATCWINAAGNKLRCASYLDGSGSRANSNTFYYWRQDWRQGDHEELALQDEGYVLNGFAFNYRSKGGTGSSSWKYVKVFNLRLHTESPEMPDGVRVVLPAMQRVKDTRKPLGYGDFK